MMMMAISGLRIKVYNCVWPTAIIIYLTCARWMNCPTTFLVILADIRIPKTIVVLSALTWNLCLYMQIWKRYVHDYCVVCYIVELFCSCKRIFVCLYVLSPEMPLHCLLYSGNLLLLKIFPVCMYAIVVLIQKHFSFSNISVVPTFTKKYRRRRSRPMIEMYCAWSHRIPLMSLLQESVNMLLRCHPPAMGINSISNGSRTGISQLDKTI